jgi:hypothetical protein
MTRSRHFARVCILVGGLLPAGSSTGQAQQPLVLQRMQGSITLDGLSDEAAWKAVVPLPVTAHYPTFGGTPTERSEFLVAHDDDYLYVAGRLHDSDPDGIRASTLRRDHNNLSTDWFGVNLDTFNDNQNLLMFATNPAGIRADFAWEQNGAEVRIDWDTFWDVAVARTSEGWFAEIRIPLSSLRFQEGGDGIVMGLTVWRHIARKNERMTFPAIEPRWGFRSVMRASETAEVLMAGVQPRTAVAVTPYALGGAGRVQALDETASGYSSLAQEMQEVGLSLKYGVTSNLTLDLTWNTDFAQVEADDQEINLTRFSLSQPEKRPFFLERSSAFDFDAGEDGRLFYSRRIGIEDGRQVPIVGGARLVGRAGGWDLAFLDLQTGEGVDAAAANYGVARVRRGLLNPRSHVGAIATTRVSGGEVRSAFGADTRLSLGSSVLSLMAAGTSGEAQGDDLGALDRALLRAHLERTGQFGLTYVLSGARVGVGVDPPVGFTSRTGYARWGGRVAHHWRLPGDSRLLRHGVAVGGSAYTRTEDRVQESARVAMTWDAEMKSGRVFALSGSSRWETLQVPFHLAPNVSVPAGAHSFSGVSFKHTPPSGALFRPELEVVAGGFYDGREVAVSFTPTWGISRHLELGGLYRISHLSFEDRDQALTTHLARVRVRAMLSTRLSVTGFAQYRSTSGGATVNLRVRYNPSEGHDLFLVFDEGLNLRRDGALPRLPLSDRRSVMVKYSHTLRLQFPR